MTGSSSSSSIPNAKSCKERIFSRSLRRISSCT